MSKILILLINAFIVQIVDSGEGVNFNHKSIAKEIQKTFDYKSYQIDELPGIVRYANNGEVIGKYFLIESENTTSDFIYIGRVFTCPAGGCDSTINSSQTNEYFDYLILFDSSLTIRNISIFNYRASYGHAICSKGWLRQFRGTSHKTTLRAGKNIDTISGATKSVSSIVRDVSARLRDLYIYNRGN